MKKVRIFDRLFSHESNPGRIGPGGWGQPPFEWVRDGVESKSVFLTDFDICDQTPIPEGYDNKVAMVLEPTASQQSDAVDVLLNDDSRYDYILTHDDELIKSDKALYCPAIQYHVSDFSPPRKERMVSMVASAKKWANGHILRHDIIQQLNGKFDLFGRGINEIDRKEDGIRPYYFSIAIENSKTDWYYTEKILDCFASHTVPIYWGCNNISDHFNADGIITFNTIEELDDILSNLTVEKYESMIDAVKENYKLVCNKFSSCENWLYKEYPFLFDKDNG